MAATNHPLVLDLGNVRGLSVAFSEPDSGEGSVGEVRINPNDGMLFVKDENGWTEYPALRDKISKNRTRTELTIRGTGDFGNDCSILNWGPIANLLVEKSNRDPSAFHIALTIGPPGIGDNILASRIPDDLLPIDNGYCIGKVFTETTIYRGLFFIPAWDTSYAGYVYCESVTLLDGSAVQENSLNVTGYLINYPYMIQQVRE